MADPKGFLKTTERELPKRRPVPVRLMDWKEVYEAGDPAQLRRQAGRCMDCGIPFCHQGCPLGNLIPEWNDLMWRGEGRQAVERLHATNNFPEFTGRLCPAPCESSCVLGINQPAVTIKQVEVSIIDQAWQHGWVQPHPPERLTGKTVAVVGSGPAGLAAAQQLTRAGHTVAVYERDDRIGGLLRYGIPDFKMEKKHLEARIGQMTAEGTRFRAGVTIGVDIGWDDLRARYDAVVVATGAMVPRDLPIPGRDLAGVHFAMEYLVQQNRAGAGDQVAAQITADGKRVVVLGGGDTGADCIGTAHRQGAASVTTLAIGKQPPGERPDHQPWPVTPVLFEVQSAHEEGGQREYLVSTIEFLANEHGEVRAVRVAETEYLDGRRVPKTGTEREIPADLVLLALGFTGPEQDGLSSQLNLPFDERGNLERDGDYQTSEAGVFVAGDAGRGQSLIVWAIAEGRAAAAAVDRYLEGETQLPAPVRPTDRGILV
ncbi:glutamate synthase subunit beta [Leifsonia xyli subsp. cynodontis DSM 46306]|uniref:Glutamate synthase n=1 Tax=Leifsonia xyli subsp. cynodontis DSM 46306 TaxID=1389489 RepID=U3P4S1_LEIXC|nr:glutamate synthase subunit beta [Leifsonia xyli]AGW41320.1 glutamate synthase subunit beta [Leifsonia xyli subsp. cynodontis DSM 46306]